MAVIYEPCAMTYLGLCQVKMSEMDTQCFYLGSVIHFMTWNEMHLGRQLYAILGHTLCRFLGFLMADKSSSRVHLRWLPLLHDFEFLGASVGDLQSWQPYTAIYVALSTNKCTIFLGAWPFYSHGFGSESQS